MESTFDVTLTRSEGYRFEVDFGEGGRTFLMDEPEPVGGGEGPNAARVLAAAVGNCLGASLLYCLQRAKIEVGEIRTRVSGSIVRNENGRLRLGSLTVRITPDFRGATPARVQRCLEIFEDFCIVTGSVRSGLDVEVEIDAPVGEDLALAGATS